jgi:hypothetical protein
MALLPDGNDLLDSVVDWGEFWVDEYHSLLDEPFAQYLCADDDAAMEDSLAFDGYFTFL